MKDKLVVITGGNSGIGSSLAKTFGEAKNKVVVVDKKSTSNTGAFYQHDLTEKKEVSQFIEKVISNHGIPDVLIFNAGRGIHQKLTEGNPDLWEKIFAVNVFSALHMIRGFVPHMLERGSGDIVFISSVSARHPYPYGGIYCASKTALGTVAETLRLEVQPRLRVLNVLPGVVDTDFFDNIIGGVQTVENIGWGAVQPEEVANAVFYAVSQRNNISLNQIIIRPTAQPM